MQYVDQTNRRRFAFATYAAYAVAALVAGAIPLMTLGLYPDLNESPVAIQHKIVVTVRLIQYTQIATFGAGAIAILATAAWLQGAYGNLEALPWASPPVHRWVATALVLVPGLNVIAGPVVMWLLLTESKDAAGERGDWFRFSGLQLVGAWVAVFAASVGIAGFAYWTFEPSHSLTNLANLQLTLLTMRFLDIAFVGMAAMILHRVDQLQEAARDETVVEDVFE